MQRKIFVQLFLQGEARLNALQIPKRQLCGNLTSIRRIGSALLCLHLRVTRGVATAQFTNSALFFFCPLGFRKMHRPKAGAFVIARFFIHLLSISFPRPYFVQQARHGQYLSNHYRENQFHFASQSVKAPSPLKQSHEAGRLTVLYHYQ